MKALANWLRPIREGPGAAAELWPLLVMEKKVYRRKLLSFGLDALARIQPFTAAGIKT